MPPTKERIQPLELMISDVNKPLLIASAGFIPYLLDALLLNPNHPRSNLPEPLKIWLQETHAECFAQLAAFAPGREKLLQDPTVIPALQQVSDGGMSAEARRFADATLMALSDKKPEVLENGELHVMLSYQW